MRAPPASFSIDLRRTWSTAHFWRPAEVDGAAREEAKAAANPLGYPVMLKSTAGGRGIGLTRCADPEALAAAYESVQRLAHNFFRDAGVFLERCIDDARHVEAQIFGEAVRATWHPRCSRQPAHL